jgi:hypothetical protein
MSVFAVDIFAMHLKDDAVSSGTSMGGFRVNVVPAGNSLLEERMER